MSDELVFSLDPWCRDRVGRPGRSGCRRAGGPGAGGRRGIRHCPGIYAGITSTPNKQTFKSRP